MAIYTILCIELFRFRWLRICERKRDYSRLHFHRGLMMSRKVNSIQMLWNPVVWQRNKSLTKKGGDSWYMFTRGSNRVAAIIAYF